MHQPAHRVDYHECANHDAPRQLNEAVPNPPLVRTQPGPFPAVATVPAPTSPARMVIRSGRLRGVVSPLGRGVKQWITQVEVVDHRSRHNRQERATPAETDLVAQEPFGDTGNRAEAKDAPPGETDGVNDGANSGGGEGIGVEGARVPAANGNPGGAPPYRGWPSRPVAHDRGCSAQPRCPARPSAH